jgi:hypothetical protein
MTLGPGRDLRKRLESWDHRLGGLAVSFGFASFTGMDDGFVIDRPTATRHSLGETGRDFVVGDAVRDWAVETQEVAIAPYDGDFKPLPLDVTARWARLLWPNRTVALSTVSFGGKTRADLGDSWWTWYRWIREKYLTELSITWASVSTHNHFALDRGGKVFRQSAPVIKLPPGTTEAEHLALLNILNSSTACFWLKQVCQTKGSSGMGRGVYDEAWEFHYDLNASNIEQLPLPAHRTTELSAMLDGLAAERATLLDAFDGSSTGTSLTEQLAALQSRAAELTARLISLQEELDWYALRAYGLVPDELPVLGRAAPPLALGQRAFEIVLARQSLRGELETSWFERHGSTPVPEIPVEWPSEYRDIVVRRVQLIEEDADVAMIERPENKRRWLRRSWADRQRDALITRVLDALEDPDLWHDGRLRSAAELADVLRRHRSSIEALALLADERDADPAATVEQLVVDAAVPSVAALRLTDRGLRKREIWERVWELQREEDRVDARQTLPKDHPDHLTDAAAAALKTERVGGIPVPPRYAASDFRSATTWRLRGKLDVPKERFVLIPNAQRGADPSPVFGWAGWDARDLARAVAGRIMELREHEAADTARLTPMLASVVELLPWIHQWYPDSDALYGGPPGRYFEMWLDGQLAELGITRDDLRAWRPPAPTKGRKAKAGVA